MLKKLTIVAVAAAFAAMPLPGLAQGPPGGQAGKALPVQPAMAGSSRNTATDCTSDPACCFRLSAAAALSSTSVAFCCVTWSI